MKYTLIKWVTVLVYVSVYIYNIWQSCDTAITLHDYRQTVLERMNSVSAFLSMSQKMFEVLGEELLEEACNVFHKPFPDMSFSAEGSLTSAYCFWTNTDNYRYRLQAVLDAVQVIDVLNSMSNLLSRPHWCVVSFSSKGGSSDVLAMDARSPWLGAKQQENNIDLRKNMVVTGPNAAGKTTYVKTLVTNVILAQTFGIAMCSQISMCVFDVISTFMRVTDVLGSMSYFEAETSYCKAMIERADGSPERSNILFVMDEPMHSTPPLEGQSTAYAVCEYIALRYPHARLIITTHFHNMVGLQVEYPGLFRNVSMEAVENEDGSFTFPYRIKSNHSFQCIAIELLGNKMFPAELIQSAIKQKNRCQVNHRIATF